MGARKYVDKIWKTENLKNLDEFTIPLSSAIEMMEGYNNIDKGLVKLNQEKNKTLIEENIRLKNELKLNI